LIYFIWYIWYYFIESNPIFIGIKGAASGVLFWLSCITIMVNIFRLGEGPQFIVPKKFELIDIFAVIGTTLLLYGFFAYVA